MQTPRLAVIALVLFTLAMIGCVTAADTGASHVISVSGSGTVTGTPDRVQISFAVQNQNADVKIAQANNALTMNNVMDALAAAGIPRAQMKTTGYTITQINQQDNNGILSGPATSYQVTNTLQVTLNDTSTAGQIIDTAVNAGANQVNSIQFMLSDEQAQALRSQALAKAVANARSDANAVAAALNVSITGTQSADISQGYTPVVYSNYDSTALAAGKAAVPTPVQAGDITVTAQVTVVYTIG